MVIVVIGPILGLCDYSVIKGLLLMREVKYGLCLRILIMIWVRIDWWYEWRNYAKFLIYIYGENVLIYIYIHMCALRACMVLNVFTKCFGKRKPL